MEFGKSRTNVALTLCRFPDKKPRKDGYVVLNRRRNGMKKRQYAHRLAYEDSIRPIPKGMQIDHICRNRHCINLAHLEIVTAKVNMQRAMHYKKLEKIK